LLSQLSSYERGRTAILYAAARNLNHIKQSKESQTSHWLEGVQFRVVDI
jgi:hypothetical protein